MPLVLLSDYENINKIQFNKIEWFRVKYILSFSNEGKYKIEVFPIEEFKKYKICDK